MKFDIQARINKYEIEPNTITNILVNLLYPTHSQILTKHFMIQPNFAVTSNK
jgi:hypothetical protein